MSLKIITYNVWHGLSGKGLLRFGELEPPGRKKLRYQWQIEELRHLDPDVLFLQEVNPLFSRAQFYASQLSMQETHELDQAGVEILGWGFPTNLKTGLCTLTKPGFGLEKLKGLKLSGPRWNWLSDRLSFQVAEFRCALISAIHWKEKVVLVVNVHLHHGPTMNAKLRKRLSGLVESGRVSAVEARWVSEAMDKADQRRANELAKLISFLKDRSGLHEGIILAGDFNCEGAPLDVVRNAGFREVTTEGWLRRGTQN